MKLNTYVAPVRAAVCFLLAASVVLASASAAAAPPEQTFELSADTDLLSLDLGQTFGFSGTCWHEAGGPSDFAFVRLSLASHEVGWPYSVRKEVDVDPLNGGFGSSLTIPDDAPSGDYVFDGACVQQDVSYRLPLATAFVMGAEPPSSSSSTTTTTTTITTSPADTPGGEATPPTGGSAQPSATAATAVPANARFTG
jgi:hypothetical protein